MPSMLMALRSGRIGRIYTTEPVGSYVCALNDDLALDTVLQAGVLLSMAVRDTDMELHTRLSDAIDGLLADCSIDELFEACMADVVNDTEPAALPHIEGAQTVRIVLTGDIPPLDYVRADGEAAGFNIALLSAIGERANLDIEVAISDEGSRVAMLASGRADVIFCVQYDGRISEDGLDVVFAEAAEGLALTHSYLQIPMA